MKVEKVDKFEPVQITLETQQEVDALYAVANFAPVGEVIGMLDQLRIELPNSPGYSVYHERLDKGMEKWYGKK